MSEDVSEMIRIAIVLVLTGALLASVLNISLQLVPWTEQTRSNVEFVANHSITEMKNLSGETVNGAQLYKYVMNNYDYISSITVCLDPSEHPDVYTCICAKQSKFVNNKIESALTSRYDASNPIDRTNYADTNLLINEYTDDSFTLEVNELNDGSLEVIGLRTFIF
ncbi:MAG: hypothetical protein NC131_15030 [Roseburia sp.]|nr:hypothetical protein [Roseburia sp.]